MTHGQTFTKHGIPEAITAETQALEWLREAEPIGGVRIVRLLRWDEHSMEMELVRAGQPSKADAEAFGRALARTHAAGAPWFTCPPVSGHGWVGHTKVLFAQANEKPSRWGESYARFRIEPYVERAIELGSLPPDARTAFEPVLTRLYAGEFDAPQPEQVRAEGHEVARLHGDLWSGNVLWAGVDTGAVLIDPLAHGGHAETDLAMLDLFGLPHLAVALSAYDEVSPLADGWRERCLLHQLNPLLFHAVLFGRPYGIRALAAATAYA